MVEKRYLQALFEKEEKMTEHEKQIVKAAKIAKILNTDFAISYYDGFFTSEFVSCWIKDDGIYRSFFGRAQYVENCVADLLDKTVGTIVNIKSGIEVNFASLAETNIT
jgi:hypothetical protein